MTNSKVCDSALSDMLQYKNKCRKIIQQLKLECGGEYIHYSPYNKRIYISDEYVENTVQIDQSIHSLDYLATLIYFTAVGFELGRLNCSTSE